MSQTLNMENRKITFRELKKNCRKRKEGLIPYKLAVLGDCATQHLVTAIDGYGYEEGYGLTIFEADYNQIDLQIMDRDSELYLFQPQFVLIYMCIQKLYASYCNRSPDQRKFFADDVNEKICSYWGHINQSVKTNILQISFPYGNDGIFGSYGLKEETSFPFQLMKLKYLLAASSVSFGNVFWIDLDLLQQRSGTGLFFDDRMYHIAKMPVALECLPEVAKGVLDIIKAIDGRMKKCVIVDLDHTLWGGIIGDDGIENIQIGELGLGQAFSDFQMWLRELKKRGILLAVCSKNQEEIAKEPFVSLSDMILHLEDFSVFVANWKDKASNIRYIQEKLNIGMDSIIFIDDNPFERNLVRELLPEVTVPELPEDPERYVEYLKSLNLFEAVAFSPEDRDRTQQYRAEEEREKWKEQISSYEEYLQGLEMTAWSAPFDKMHYSRIAQLTQRSNQFNLRTIRYTEEEIKEVASNEKFITLYFCLCDKFGDHGLVSVVILEKKSKEELFILEWLMSCRVLKRGMEGFVVNHIIKTAKMGGYKKVIGEYRKTPKNQMVEKIYSKLGFTEIAEHIFEADVENFQYNDTYIKENHCNGQTENF